MSGIIGMLFTSTIFGASGEKISSLEKQIDRKYQVIGEKYPEYTVDGEWKFREKPNWFSGFIGGQYWLTYELTGKQKYKEWALARADHLLQFADLDNTHDMGFIFLPTAVRSYKETGQEKYRKAGIQAAEMLAKRFNENGEFIRAWGKLGTPEKAGWMIIDTMMNLELLFWAAEETGNWEYYDIAYKHALTTMRESLRDDGSSYHVIEFNTETGAVQKRRTHQGYHDESTWARGQAWGIYGFANAYRYTGDQRFLNISKAMADYFLAHLPEDHVPYWDLNLSGEDVVRDASAGAIAASGMYLLAEKSQRKKDVLNYRNNAHTIVNSLVEKYLYTQNDRETEQGLLLHSVYNYHKDWGVDEANPAGDYYFLEAVYKQHRLQREKHFIRDTGIRTTYNLNREWFYSESSAEQVDGLYPAANDWEKVDLPHTWNVGDVMDPEPGYRRDAGWYEKTVFIPAMSGAHRYLLYFEGANLKADVYINNQLAGSHIGGYLGFKFDITEFLQANTENTIRVRVDNSYDPKLIPSQKSDFFIYGGLTRDVWLKVVSSVYVSDLKISTPEVSAESAQTNAEVSIRNTSENRETLTLSMQILDATGKVVSQDEKRVRIGGGESEKVTVDLPSVSSPNLWSPDSPYLYTVQTELRDGNERIDSISDKIGYRWYKFEKNGPFYLNGERLLIRGTHRHEEHAGYGNAMPNRLHIKDMQAIKEMGANYVRLAHYPQEPAVYDAADSLGLLIWDELPWCRGGIGGPEWQANTTRLLKEMIRQNYNHPSIILWSLGNEVYWLPDFEDGGNTDSLKAFMTELNELAHNLDPGRLTATRKFPKAPDIVDVYSPSIWAGWYSGVYKNYKKALESAREKNDRFVHMEYGGASHKGRHTEHPITGEGMKIESGWTEKPNQYEVKSVAKSSNWTENYIVDLFDWHLYVSENTDWFTGNAQWAVKDFGTPLRPENAIPFVNQKGLLDRAGNPKDAYYVYKSYWTDSPKFAYIESHTWTHRSGPKGVAREVTVYSNCESVELQLNGESLGKKDRDESVFPAQGLIWEVNFRDGANELVAVGYTDDEKVTADSLSIEYSNEKAGSPEEIVMSASELPNGNVLVEALFIDDEGRRCLDINDRIYFTADGSGHLVPNQGIMNRSSVVEAANGRAAIEVVPVPGERTVIEARNQDFKGSYLELSGRHVMKRSGL